MKFEIQNYPNINTPLIRTSSVKKKARSSAKLFLRRSSKVASLPIEFRVSNLSIACREANQIYVYDGAHKADT